MSDKPRILTPRTASAWTMQIAHALGLDGARIRRLVIDSEAGQVLKVYVEYYGDERLLSVEPPPRELVQIIREPSGGCSG